MTQTKRQCGTCVWWGTNGVYVPPRHKKGWTVSRRCKFPIPKHRPSLKALPHHAGGDCQTWKSSVQADTNDA